jgi:hypothetical protein
MSAKIRIRNLPNDAESSSVQDFLTMVGDVFTIRMALENGSQTAYVQMMTDDQARDCVQRFNNQRFRDKVITVAEDTVRTRIAATR